MLGKLVINVFCQKEQKGVMVGDMQMNINCTISGKNTALELTGHTNPATVDVSGEFSPI